MTNPNDLDAALVLSRFGLGAREDSFAAIAANPGLEITVDVQNSAIRYGPDSIPATNRESARDALINGRWDAIGELLEGVPAVKVLTAQLPYLAA